MNTVAYFEIQVSDVQKAIAFYQNVFEWKFIKEEFVPIEYHRIETSGIHGGLMKRPAQNSAPRVGHKRFYVFNNG